jgi:uncharacterized membrane protein YphA (DoxX/SURF4 family)
MPRGGYGFVALRLVVAAIWINSVSPKLVALAKGQPNGLVRNLFGSSMAVPLTYFFTVLEILGAVAFILGLLVRLASVWGVIEFAIICTNSVLVGNIAAAIAGLNPLMLAASLVLLLNGSPKLSLDGLIAKHKTSK